MLFADRIQKHLVESNGALASTNVFARWDEIIADVTSVSRSWIENWENPVHNRRYYVVDMQAPSHSMYFTSPEAPNFGLNGGLVPDGYTLTMSKSGGGSIYYATDGNDPRDCGGATYSGAISHSGGATLDKSAIVKARVKDSSNWSPLKEETFAIDNLVDDVRVTEIMYRPKDTGSVDDPNAEFIELQNIAAYSVNFNLVSFDKGIHFTFGDIDVPAGGYVVVVKDIAVFAAHHPTFGGTIAGTFIGRLDNGGEQIRLVDALDNVIQDFKYKDGWHDHTDGDGYTLTMIDPTSTEPNDWSDNSGWRPSAYLGGSPGWDDSAYTLNPKSIVINEVLAHSDLYPNDWVELRNTTGSSIDITGWYLSDKNYNLKKYQIPSTLIPAGGYAVFTQDDHFGVSGATFGLSESGETVYLTAPEDSNGNLKGYRDKEDFEASENGVTFGRHLKSTGTHNFVSMSSPTSGAANAYPKVDPIVISEIMYHPTWPDYGPYTNEQYEYVELYNNSGSPVTLYDHGEPWKFTDGIRYTFPEPPDDVTLPAGGYVIIAKDPDAFELRYNVPSYVEVLGPYGGKLSNSGEKLEVSKPSDEVDATGEPFYIRVDRVSYSDGIHHEDFDTADPWPAQADAGGKSLTRTSMTHYGNDPNVWTASDPTPGRLAQGALVINEFMASNTSTIQDPQGDYDDWIEIHNTTGSPIDIGGYYLSDSASGIPNDGSIPTGDPATIIPGGGYLIIWADGDTGDGSLHVSFGLGAGGDQIGLYYTDGVTEIDFINFDAQSVDVSFGRSPDGINNWKFYTSPTPGTGN